MCRSHVTGGGDQLHLEEFIDRVTKLPGQIPSATSEGETGDTGLRDESERNDETGFLGRLVDIAEGASGLDDNGPRGYIHLHSTSSARSRE